MGTGEKACYILAVPLFLLGAAMRFIYTAVRFTGFLCWCAAAALVLLALLGRWGRRWSWARRCRRILLALALLGTLLFTGLEACVVSGARTDWPESPEAMVILGAGVNGTEPSLSLASRLEAALYYIGQDPAQFPIVVTGSQGPNEAVSEAACMAQWLVEHNVDPERIVLEEQADTTKENVAFSQALLAERGVDRGAAVAIVSSDYHLCRARWLWGDGAYAVAAYLPGRFWPLTLNYYVREAFALAAAMVF